MMTPSFDRLRAMANTPGMPRSWFNGVFMHPNPRFYKYDWRIFWEGSEMDGQAFLESAPLATKAAFDLIERLKSEGKPHLVYCERRRRLGVAAWNYASPKIRGSNLAPAYDDDPDPPVADGHK